MLKCYFVTGANKGIGLAVVRRILLDIPNSFVFLGSRDEGRGKDAIVGLEKENGKFKGRLELVPIDCASDESISNAAKNISKQIEASKDMDRLHGLVNNAGVLSASPETILTVNVKSVHTITNSLLPLLKPGSRVVHVSSGAAPNFVQSCNEKNTEFFLNKSATWDDISSLLKKFENKSQTDQVKVLKEMGVSGANAGSFYGFSKALLNLLTIIMGREYESKKIVVNSCSPGYIATDMTVSAFFGGSYEAAAKNNLKTADQGTVAIMHLLTSDKLHGTGHYYGSDAKRSPMATYRSPGDPEYTGER